MGSWFHTLPTALVVAVAAAAAGCAPEITIARSDATSGGSAGTASGGTAGGGAAGTGTAGAATQPSGGEAGAPPEAEAPRLLADSVADFSMTQGEHGWYYGYDTGSLDTFTLLTRKSIITQYMPVSNDVWECWANDTAHWTQIFQLGAHPNGTITSGVDNSFLQRAVRRWVSNFAGDVLITGELAKIDVTVNGSNGVDAIVYVDGVVAYAGGVVGEDGGGLSYEATATVQVDSTVDFVLDAHENDDHHDLTRFTGIIARVERLPSE